MAVATDDSVFVMHGARAAVAGGMLHIEEQVKALELATGEKYGPDLRSCQDAGRECLQGDHY